MATAVFPIASRRATALTCPPGSSAAEYSSAPIFAAAVFMERPGIAPVCSTRNKTVSTILSPSPKISFRAVSNQRPDLFAAATPAAAVLDMLRYDKFTNGAAWIAEYGAPSDPKMFGVLMRYSPSHNIKAGIWYPATLVVTGDCDDRVVPSHSFKYTAGLQKARACNRPVLLRVDRGTSHSYQPTDRRLAEITDRWAFIAAATGIKSSRRGGS